VFAWTHKLEIKKHKGVLASRLRLRASSPHRRKMPRSVELSRVRKWAAPSESPGSGTVRYRTRCTCRAFPRAPHAPFRHTGHTSPFSLFAKSLLFLGAFAAAR